MEYSSEGWLEGPGAHGLLGKGVWGAGGPSVGDTSVCPSAQLQPLEQFLSVWPGHWDPRSQGGNAQPSEPSLLNAEFLLQLRGM